MKNSKKNQLPVIANWVTKTLTRMKQKKQKTGQKGQVTEKKLKTEKNTYHVEAEIVIKSSAFTFSRLKTEFQ